MAYPGGKNGAGVYQTIINLIPPHDIYIEPFLGGGAVLRKKHPAAHNFAMDIDPEVLRRFPQRHTPSLTILHANALEWLPSKNFTPSTFIYLDPPYLTASRARPDRIYRHEFTDDDHKRLLSIILSLPCMVMISGYPNAMYDDALSAWHTYEFQTTVRSGRCVTEKLWMNYPPPHRLHDYQYLGRNFRERERIKKKKARWTGKLLAMQTLERYALESAIADLEELGHPRHIERAAPALHADHRQPDPLQTLCTKCGWPDPIAMAEDTRSPRQNKKGPVKCTHT